MRTCVAAHGSGACKFSDRRLEHPRPGRLLFVGAQLPENDQALLAVQRGTGWRRGSFAGQTSVKVGSLLQDPRGVVMSEALSIHHDQAGHQFETNVDGHRAYLTYICLLYTSPSPRDRG